MNTTLQCAAVKLQRALANAEAGDGCFDPISGYSGPEIVRWLLDRGPDGERIVARHQVHDLARVNY